MSILDIINEAIDRKINSKSFTNIVEGIVVGVQPLEISIDDRLVLGEDFLDFSSLLKNKVPPNSPPYKLETGDKVRLLRYQGGQRYLILDNITEGIIIKLSELEQDELHRLVTDVQINSWNAKSNFSGSYNDLTNKPTTFPPSTHTHPWSQVTDKPPLFDNSTYLGTTSLNSITTPGVYYQNADVNATTARNYPTSYAGTLVVTTAAGIIQEYTCYGPFRHLKYVRGYYNGNWSSWSRVSFEGHVHSAGDITAGVLAVARIPNLNANKITSGTFDEDRIPMIDRDKLINNQVPKFLSIGNGTDLNNVRTSGWYRFGGTGAYVNGPLGSAGHFGIFVVYSDGNPTGMCKQEYTHTSGAVYSRISSTTGVWTAWARIV